MAFGAAGNNGGPGSISGTGKSAPQSLRGPVAPQAQPTPSSFLVCLGLAFITFAVYASVLGHKFVYFDDKAYITENPHVRSGLSTTEIGWAFSHGYVGNWHPLTWISHMLDCQLWGLSPTGHHFSSLLLHIANSVLLFLVLVDMTAERWRSALVAALFAWHPLHVESVAWVSERKDVLSAFFFMLTLLAYSKYAQALCVHEVRSTKHGARWYALTLVLFALGLMAKPMLVTVPFVLLLIDYWPLRRFSAGDAAKWRVLYRIVLEKAPFFVLAGASSAVTFWIQQRAGAISSLEQVPVSLRMQNALISYVAYIIKLFWPVNLAAFYPFRVVGNEFEIVGSILLLLAATVGVLITGRRFPFLPIGWFWYVGMLVPVIGLVQTGGQAMADRYTYLPSIGLFMVLAWAIPEKWLQRPYFRSPAVVCAVLVLSSCLVTTAAQLRYWTDNNTLFEHALAVTSNNAFAHANLAESLRDEGDSDGAVRELSLALDIKPNYREARLNLGSVLLLQGRSEDAIAQFQEAVRLYPGYAIAHNNLAEALMERGRLKEAIDHCQTALKLQPELPDALNNLAWLRATAPDPSDRDGKEAERLASKAAELTNHRHPAFLDTLAAALAENGQFEEAIRVAGEAQALAIDLHQEKIAQSIGAHIELFRNHTPCRSWEIPLLK